MVCRPAISLPPVIAPPPPPGTSASPGFTWSRFGDSMTGTYLLNDGVPSNIAGRKVPFTGQLTRIFVTSENDDTFTIDIMRRTAPNTYVTIQSVSLVAARAQTFTGLTAIATLDDELAAQISAGNCRNVEIGVIIEQV